MSIAGYSNHITTVTFADPAAASASFPIMKAPAVGMTIIRAHAIHSATFNADGSNHFTVGLVDGGADGTGTDSMGSVGGASVDTTALTGRALTLTQTGLDGGDWLLASYAETGTVAPGTTTIVVEWAAGGS
jgi:hypothetical protein